jgi:ankyrin repeat protein
VSRLCLCANLTVHIHNIWLADGMVLDDAARVAECQYEKGRSLLMLAAKRGHFDCVSAILEHTRDNELYINQADSDGMTALMHAARSGCIESFNKLLSCNASHEPVDLKGRKVHNHGELRPLLPRVDNDGAEYYTVCIMCCSGRLILTRNPRLGTRRAKADRDRIILLRSESNHADMLPSVVK